MSALLVVKAQLKGDLRRLSVSLAVTLAELRATLQKLYSIEDLARYTIKYTDDEGDLVTLATNDDLAEAVGVAIALNSTAPVLRLTLVPNAELTYVPSSMETLLRTSTVVFQAKDDPAEAQSESTSAPVAEVLSSTDGLPVSEWSAPDKKHLLDIKIQVVIEKLSVVPTNQRPGVASLSSATASLVKELSDSLLLSMAPFHLRTLTDNAESTASTIASTTRSSDAVRDAVNSQERSFALPTEFVQAVGDLASQTTQLTHSVSQLTRSTLDPLARETMALQAEATKNLAGQINDEVSAIMRMLNDTHV